MTLSLRSLCSVALSVALLCLAAPLSTPRAQRLTQGVLQAEDDLAAGTDAQQVERNPAGLAFGGTFDAALSWTQAQGRVSGDGLGLYLSLGVLDPYHMGLGLQLLDGARADQGRVFKVSWAHALRFREVLSVGLSWHALSAEDDPLLDDLSTWDLGLQLRPWRWLAFGLTLTDLSLVPPKDSPLRRGYEFAVALRPGTERLTLTGQLRTEQSGDRAPDLGARLRWRLAGPLALIARYDALDEGERWAHRVLLGLANLDEFGFGLFGYTPDARAQQPRAGFSASAHLRSDPPKLPSLFVRPTVVQVQIGEAQELSASGWLSPETHAPFLQSLRALQRIAQDDEIHAVLLSFQSSSFGWAQAAELRSALDAVRASGKKVYAWLSTADLKSYSVAVSADEVYGAPAGGLFITGIELGVTYLGVLLRRFGVNADFVAIGDYKSAPETFTEGGPSDAAREQTEALLDEIFNTATAYIAQRRPLSLAQVKAQIDEAPFTSAQAQARGLLDGVLHYDELEGVARRDFGPRVSFVPAQRLLAKAEARWGNLPKIAVLYAVGTITDGESVANPLTGVASTGAQSFIQAVRQARENPQIRAVVLRVDSPGGSVTAADAMWRELSQLARVKPLVVSMGDTAASGGYYIAAPGARIFASAQTLTGSIGIFSGKFDLSGLFSFIGLQKTEYRRGADASLMSNQAKFTEGQREKVRAGLQALYDLFIDRVAQGRGQLTREAVLAAAGGRVWSGAAARERGLVDRSGGLLAAIDDAAARAGLAPDDYQLRILPQLDRWGGLPTSPFGQLRARLTGPSDAALHGAQRLQRQSDTPLERLRAQLPPQIELLLDAPLMHFEQSQPLALLPFLWQP